MALKAWIQRNGTDGRRRIFKAIQAEFPNFTQVSLTNYIQGQRVPDYQVAKIISEVTGIPIILLPFRLVHNPERAKTK
jgi:hypothetical protein